MKTLTVNGKPMVLEEVCPECGPESDLGICPAECELCHGTGTITHHYTPEQYKQKGLETTPFSPVWRYQCGEWNLAALGVVGTDLCVMAIGQPAPPVDYRPETR